MSWYEITRSCGHTESIQIYGTNVHGERERKAALLAEQPCGDCRRAGRDQAASAQAAELGLHALTGSERQVAWAMTIRATAMTGLGTWRAQIAERLASHPDEQERADELLATLATVVAGHTDARWWIDNRVRTVDVLQREVVAAIDGPKNTSGTS